MRSVDDRMSHKYVSSGRMCPRWPITGTNSSNVSHINCTLPGDEHKRKKIRVLQWKHSRHIGARVAVSEALIRLRNLLLPRHQLTHGEQKPASVCQTWNSTWDQLCSEWRSWCKCVTWMGWQQPGFSAHQVSSVLIILCWLVPARLCSRKATRTQGVLQQTKWKLKGN